MDIVVFRMLLLDPGLIDAMTFRVAAALRQACAFPPRFLITLPHLRNLTHSQDLHVST
jgi:hypothetical protein